MWDMKNKYVQILLISIVIIGGFALYLKQVPDKDYSEEEIIITTNTQETELIKHPIIEDTETIKTNNQFDGAHIMSDGTIMSGDMKPISDATILPDGTVRLSDGTIFTPAFDFRKKEEKTSDPIVETTNQITIDVVGINFSYDKTEIRVKKGDVVTINFTSTAGFHDWVIDEFDAATERVDKGEKSSVTFIADKAGTFQYYCSVRGHREKGQVGYLIVE